MIEQNPVQRRMLRNFLLHPNLQIRLGIYYMLIAVIFSLIVVTISYLQMHRFLDIVIELTEVPDEIRDVATQYLSDSFWVLAIALALFFAATITATVVYTHKLVGPAKAFERHIQHLQVGRYSERVVLREGDAFDDVATALNQLAAALEEKHDSLSNLKESEEDPKP